MLCNISNRVHNCIALLLFFPASKLSNQPHQIPQCWNYACYHDNLGKKSLYFFYLCTVAKWESFWPSYKIKIKKQGEMLTVVGLFCYRSPFGQSVSW